MRERAYQENIRISKKDNPNQAFSKPVQGASHTNTGQSTG